MTVRDFIIRHPEATLDLMTPGGYVYLKPEQARDMLNGQSAMGHPGDPVMGIEMTAEELLPQTICSANFSKGEWHMLTDYSPEESEQQGKEVENQMEKETKLRERVKANYDDYIRQLQSKPAPDLIEMASEIAAAKFVYEELMVEGYFSDSTDYLLSFENPLAQAIGCWQEDQDFDRHEDLTHALWVAKETDIGRGLYTPEKEPELETPALEQGVAMC